MANTVPDRGGDPRRGTFIHPSGTPMEYGLAINRPGTGDKAWQVDAWHPNSGRYLGSITHWGASREDALKNSHKRMQEEGKLPHNDEEYAKPFRKSRSYY